MGKKEKSFPIFCLHLEEGAFFYPGGTGVYRDVVCIGAPYIIGDEEISLMDHALTTAINDVIG